MTSSSGERVGPSDIVLVNFMFSEETGSKRRPVVVLSSHEYHLGRQEALVAAVTSNTARVLPGDHLLQDWNDAGLPLPSVATGIIRTIKRGMISRAIGTVSERDMRTIENNLKSILGLAD